VLVRPVRATFVALLLASCGAEASPPSHAPDTAFTPVALSRPPPPPAPALVLDAKSERWTSALDGYVPVVAKGNQRQLVALRAFAVYVNGMHQHMHPLFAEGFLMKELEPLGHGDPRNDVRLITRVEIVVGADGQIAKMGVVKSSGVVGFDVGVLESVHASAPFAPVPPELLSSDGRLYVHWDFHRDPVISCSTINAMPYRLELVAATTL
jgi:TonB family protein